MFRSAIPDTKFAADLVDFINEKFPGKKKFAFIYVNDDFGRGGFEGFKARGDKYGYRIVAEERYTRGDLDFTSQLSRIKESGADIMVDWSRYAEGALIIKQKNQMGIEMPYFGSDGQAHPKFRELAGSAAEGAYYPTHFSVAAVSGNKVAETLTTKIRDAYKKDPDYVHAQAWDAMTATELAIEKAGSLDRTKIRDELRTVEFDGARGHFKFDAKGDPTLQAIVVIVKNGQEANAR